MPESDQSRLSEQRPKAASDQPPPLNPTIAALSAPLSVSDPCGPDLDSESDTNYLNFFAQVDGILPTSFFSLEDGKPFDPSAIDIGGQLGVLKPLLERSRDIRLLTVQARLLILNKDLAGFAMTVGAIAQLLDTFWDAVHPRPEGGDLEARAAAISTLDSPTVVFPLQYAPLFEGRRIGLVTYRRWMIATGEVKPRAGEAELAAAAITEAINEASPNVLETVRDHVALLNTSIDRIRRAFVAHGNSAGLEALPALAGRVFALISPYAAAVEMPTVEAGGGDSLWAQQGGSAVKAAGPPPASIADAAQALATIADYYSRSEPSSPTLPLVRQAHRLIGKSFFEIMTILVPSQVDNAAFQIGTDAVFDLPVSKLSALSETSRAMPQAASVGGESPDPAFPSESRQYRIESRSQAIALLDQVQRYFRITEPSSPIPMLCERARALAERDFMGVLRDVLPKSALKNINADK